MVISGTLFLISGDLQLYYTRWTRLLPLTCNVFFFFKPRLLLLTPAPGNPTHKGRAIVRHLAAPRSFIGLHERRDTD